jgi:hypothetical protein
LIREKDKLLHLGVINIAGTSNKALVAQQKINPSIQRSNILATTRKTRVPNPLSQLLLPMVTKDQNQKVRRLRDIAIFVGEMVI